MSVLAELHALVERFDRDRDSYRSGRYNEAQARVDFLNPLLGLLGWDVENREGRPEAYRDVVYEDRVKVGGGTKAPDYGFYAGGRRRFFLEAKKPSVNIAGDLAPAVQLRRYAWSARLPLSVLTDFEEFAIYDCRSEPEKDDSATTARLALFTYDCYTDEAVWERISSIFSREAVLDGSLERYAEENRKRRGKETVDAAFLHEIEGWRSDLARDIAARNDLNTRGLNFAVQMTIDRIIFLRMAEDRGIEDYGRLMALLNGGDTYLRLCEIFRDADDRYNSGLFHFRTERGRDEEPDRLTPAIQINDTVLKGIIRGLYYPESPYEFSVLPVDVLGQVYEQFLGRVIRLEDGHTATVEEKPEVRKAGGVYYTPTYIVDYIVEKTVGKLLEGKRPGPRGGASRLRIVDPACGSGSFLIGAYRYLLDWHRDRYVEDGLEKWKDCLYEGPGGQHHLTIDEKRRILLNNIFGVDIDPQAVEVTKLSLLLKVLEGESEASLATQLRMFQERGLPDLDANIKCGNSLIAPDFYDNEQMMLLDEEEHYRINVFDWQESFPQVFQGDNPGFDAVIGNPPYVDVKLLGEDRKRILSDKFASATKRFDLYVPFVEQGLLLLRNDGLLGYILPSMFTRREYGSDLRRVIVQLGSVDKVVDFGTNQVFAGPLNYVGIFILRKSREQSDVSATRFDRTGLGSVQLAQGLSGKELKGVNRLIVPAQAFHTSSEWYLLDKMEARLSQQLFDSFPGLETLLKNASEGIHSGKDQVFFVPTDAVRTLGLERPPAYPLAKGKDVHRYQAVRHVDLSNFVIYPYILSTGAVLSESALAQLAPNTWEYLKSSRRLLKGRSYFDKSRKNWYELWCPRTPELYTSPKLVGPEIASRGEFTLCREGLFINNKLKAIILRDGIGESLEYILGLLNSSLLLYLHRSIAPPKSNNFFEVKTTVLGKVPIRTIDFSDPDDAARHDRMVELVGRMLELHERLAGARIERERTVIGHQISATDRQIDRLVYELYGLTDEEIRIVEEGTAQ